MLQRTPITIELTAAPLTNRSPVLPTLGKKRFWDNETKKKRDASRERKDLQLKREDESRVEFQVDPDHDRLCRAVARHLARADKTGKETALTRFIRTSVDLEAIRNGDKKALSVLGTAVIDDWAMDET